MSRVLLLLVASWVWACARPMPTRAPEPPGATATPKLDPRTDDRVQLRFVDVAKLEITSLGRSRGVALDVHDEAGAVLLAAGGPARGVMVPLSRVVEGTAPQTFAIEATSACPQPWIVDVDAALLGAGLEVTGVPASLRIGCGPVQHVDLVTAFGVQRVVVYGDAGFDVRMVAAELGIIRTDLERIFAVHIAQRWLDEVVIEPSGARPLPRARATTTGMRIAMETDRGWDAAPRLEVGATVARVWAAKMLDAIAAKPDPNAAHLHAALVHGLAHGVARESLFALGLLSPTEYASELDGAEALVAERAVAWRVAGIVDARDVAAAAAAHSIEVARVAWSMRQTGDPASLPDVLERAADGTRPATTLWAQLAGSAAARAFGPCIVARKVRATAVDLGYATAWDPEQSAETISAVQDGGPAAAAGLRVGDHVVHTDTQRRLVRVLREGQAVAIEVPARPRSMMRRGWIRRAGVDDDRCYPST